VLAGSAGKPVRLRDGCGRAVWLWVGSGAAAALVFASASTSAGIVASDLDGGSRLAVGGMPGAMHLALGSGGLVLASGLVGEQAREALVGVRDRGRVTPGNRATLVGRRDGAGRGCRPSRCARRRPGAGGTLAEGPQTDNRRRGRRGSLWRRASTLDACDSPDRERTHQRRRRGRPDLFRRR